MLCCRLLTFFSKLTFSKILSGTLSGCQTVWIQIRTDALSVLIWVKTVCKGYQQTTKFVASKEKVNSMSKAPVNMINKDTKFIPNSVDFYIIAKSTNFDRNNNLGSSLRYRM